MKCLPIHQPRARHAGHNLLSLVKAPGGSTQDQIGGCLMSSTTPPPGESRQSDPTPADGAETFGEQPSYGFPSGLWRAIEHHRPPGLGRARVWRSPLRGPWLTSVFGGVLLASLPLVILTGLLDYIAYGPQFGQAIPGNVGWLHLPIFD